MYISPFYRFKHNNSFWNITKIIMLFQSGVYIKCEIHIFAPPPPFLIHIFSPKDIYYNEVVRIFPPFFILFNHFFPQHDIGKYFWSNRKIYTPGSSSIMLTNSKSLLPDSHGRLQTKGFSMSFLVLVLFNPFKSIINIQYTWIINSWITKKTYCIELLHEMWNL